MMSFENMIAATKVSGKVFVFAYLNIDFIFSFNIPFLKLWPVGLELCDHVCILLANSIEIFNQ